MPILISIQSLLIKLYLVIKRKLQHLLYWSKTWDKTCEIGNHCRLDLKNKIIIGKKSKINDFVVIKTKNNFVTIGENVQINFYCVIYGGAGVKIGNDVMIGPHVMIASGNHDFLQVDRPMRHAGNIEKGPIIIEDDVWIGSHVCILDGVKIGKGSVVGAGSIVTKNIPEYSVIAGVPAKVLWKRK